MWKFFERVDSRRNDKPGVLKIELRNTYDKVEVLKAKRKCDLYDETKNVRIQTCDSHESHVAKLNARFFLNKLSDPKEYIITSHGLICKKDTEPDEG